MTQQVATTFDRSRRRNAYARLAAVVDELIHAEQERNFMEESGLDRLRP